MIDRIDLLLRLRLTCFQNNHQNNIRQETRIFRATEVMVICRCIENKNSKTHHQYSIVATLY